MMSDEVAGADFLDTKPPKNCKTCGGELLVALVRLSDGRIKWRNFARIPKERDGRRYYLRHSCPR
jgi:hypothetical protein